uniref:LAGLIDADG endonuclease n=2 Tax=Monilinia laxa TaxID=61186 RepID=A0A7L8EY69_MONLA|nr:LAGLIDADG endonuclease [Monilinia laxa]QOE17448.1 LAGLIDADG endonuclease [Monilinia laxa]
MTSTTFFFVFIPILAVILLAVNLIFAPHNPKIWNGKSIINWDKLSNSGNALKILIPSHIWKYMSGWSNYSGFLLDCFGIVRNLINKVKSQNIYESLIGNRGSKSVLYNYNTVKEQRVNGSCIKYNNKKYNLMLRCTLVGFERSYQIKIPSNSINLIRNLSTLESKLDPSYVTGFTDGEGSFMLTIIKDNKYKTGWRVACRFAISLHKKDIILLNKIKNFFNTGNVYYTGKDASQYRVESLKGLENIINHFDKYPLKTKKQVDYNLFKLAYNLIKNKNHTTKDGLLKLVALKAGMNRGLNDELLLTFPDIVPILIPENFLNKSIEPFWLSGFTDAEGCFSVVVFKNKTSKYGEAIKLSFILTQSIRDEYLIKSLIEYLGCGYTSLDDRGTIDFKVSNFSSIKDIIIPYFKKYSLYGNKFLDFADFSKVVLLMENKKHLTQEGLDEIKKIRDKMNTNRKQ